VARLCIDSEAHTRAELDAIVGSVADEGWERGSDYTIAGRVRQNRFSRWALVERAPGVEDGDAAVERLLHRARALAVRLAAVPPGVRVSLGLFVTQPNDVFGLGLSPEQLQFLASIRAALEQSFVVARETGTTDHSN
jgi:hypothetical protein